MTLPNVPQDPNMSEAVRAWLERVKRDIDAALSAVDGIDVTFASEAEAEAGTSQTVYMNPLRTSQAIIALSPFGNDLIHVRDEKTAGTDGGTFTSGAWQTRTLNTTVTNLITGASLASNLITLPAGRYFVYATAPAFAVQTHQARLYDTTGTAELVLGTSERANASGASNTSGETRSIVAGQFTLSTSSDVRLEHQCNASQNTTGYGVGHAFNVGVFATAMIWKVE
jgi:hypothetical protein